MSSTEKRTSSRARSSSAKSSDSFSLESCFSSFTDANDSVMWVVRVVLLIYASFVASNLPSNMTWLFDNTFARLVVVLLILGLAMCDPASAILLTIGFVLSIQAANKQHISKLANVATTAHTAESFMAEVASHTDNASHGAPSATSHGAPSATPHVPPSHPSLASVDSVQHTLNQVVHPSHQATNTVHPNTQQLFTTPKQMHTIQSNTVQDNQNTEVRTWQQELGPQGLSQPTGYNFNASTEGAFATTNPNCAPVKH